MWCTNLGSNIITSYQNQFSASLLVSYSPICMMETLLYVHVITFDLLEGQRTQAEDNCKQKEVVALLSLWLDAQPAYRVLALCRVEEIRFFPCMIIPWLGVWKRDQNEMVVSCLISWPAIE